MSRYTYSTDKTVRAKCDPICTTEYDFEILMVDDVWKRHGGGWGNSKKGYYHDKTKFHAPTLRGLLDKIAGEK